MASLLTASEVYEKFCFNEIGPNIKLTGSMASAKYATELLSLLDDTSDDDVIGYVGTDGSLHFNSGADPYASASLNFGSSLHEARARLGEMKRDILRKLDEHKRLRASMTRR